MADEFDGCECIWSHELAMQRLLAFIRQNQEECTDTTCVDVPSLRLPSPSTGGSDSNSFVIMTMFMIFAVIMYFIRPEAILNLTKSKKRSPNGQDPNGPPPPPAPPAIH